MARLRLAAELRGGEDLRAAGYDRNRGCPSDSDSDANRFSVSNSPFYDDAAGPGRGLSEVDRGVNFGGKCRFNFAQENPFAPWLARRPVCRSKISAPSERED